MVREVTDCKGFPESKGLHIVITTHLYPNKDNFLTFVNHGVYLKNWCGHPVWMDRSLAMRAGLSSGTGNILSHLSIATLVKTTVWKRSCWHNGTHDFDTRGHDWRELELVVR